MNNEQLIEAEDWWEFLRKNLKQKMHSGEPLTTLTGVKNTILEVGSDYFKVQSEKRKSLDSRNITKKRIQYVLNLVKQEGHYNSVIANRHRELMTFSDEKGPRFGAHTSIIRGLLVYLPFIKREGRAGIIFSASDYDKNKWGLDL